MSQPYEIGYHNELGRYFLYLDAGRDPLDGTQLRYATPLLPNEALLWQQGEIDRLERSIRGRGIPLPGPCGIREGKFRRFLRRIREKLSRQPRGQE